MIALDTSFLIDYLAGTDAAAEFLEANQNSPFFAPTLALFEVYGGAARSDQGRHLERVISGLDWVEPLPLTENAAREAAAIEAELLDTGNRVNLADILIAGVCRDVNAKLVSRDDHFERIAKLDVVNY